MSNQLLALTMALAPALGWFGCGASTQQTADKTRLRTTVQELESSARADRRKMRDLQYELARLESQLNKATPAAPSGLEVDDLPDDLPVQVLHPEGAGSGFASSIGASRPMDEQYEIVDTDEDGVEIVYVGDAAKDESVRPDTRYLAPRPSVPTRAARTASRPNRRTPVSAEWDAISDRLAVTDGAGPTVARQLAAARRHGSRVQLPARIEPVAPATVAGTDAHASSKSDPKAEYSRSYQALRAGQHESAVAGFRLFIERHPKHAYADNARYWLAEAFYDQRDYRRALTEFRKVERDYPTGNKIPDALLKIAYCRLALGQHRLARAALAQLTERYPLSKPAALANQRLATLDGEPVANQ